MKPGLWSWGPTSALAENETAGKRVEIMNLLRKGFQVEVPWDKDSWAIEAAPKPFFFCPDTWETCLAAHYCSLPSSATSPWLL